MAEFAKKLYLILQKKKKNSIFSTACILAWMMIIARSQWIKIFFILSTLATELLRTRCSIGFAMALMRFQKHHSLTVHFVSMKCAMIRAPYSLLSINEASVWSSEAQKQINYYNGHSRQKEKCYWLAFICWLGNWERRFCRIVLVLENFLWHRLVSNMAVSNVEPVFESLVIVFVIPKSLNHGMSYLE